MSSATVILEINTLGAAFVGKQVFRKKIAVLNVVKVGNNSGNKRHMRSLLLSANYFLLIKDSRIYLASLNTEKKDIFESFLASGKERNLYPV